MSEPSVGWPLPNMVGVTTTSTRSHKHLHPFHTRSPREHLPSLDEFFKCSVFVQEREEKGGLLAQLSSIACVTVSQPELAPTVTEAEEQEWLAELDSEKYDVDSGSECEEDDDFFRSCMIDKRLYTPVRPTEVGGSGSDCKSSVGLCLMQPSTSVSVSASGGSSLCTSTPMRQSRSVLQSSSMHYQIGRSPFSTPGSVLMRDSDASFTGGGNTCVPGHTDWGFLQRLEDLASDSDEDGESESGVEDGDRSQCYDEVYEMALHAMSCATLHNDAT